MRRTTNFSLLIARGIRVLPALGVIALSAAFSGCGDDADDRSAEGGTSGSGTGGSGRGDAGRGGSGGGRGGAGPGGGGGSAFAGMAGRDGGAGGGGAATEGGAGGEGPAGSGGTAGSAGAAGDSGAAGHGGEAGACSAGYEARGGECVDLDECSAPGGHECPADRVCINTDGSHECACSAGYTEVDGACVATCAPRDFDGASVALGLGHIDLIAASYDEGAGELRLFVSDDSYPVRQPKPVLRAPEDVLVHGKPSARLEVPDIPALAGILEPGTNVWLLPEGQPEAEAAGLIWPGFQSYGVAAGVFVNDRVLVRLLSHDGTGKFVAFGTVQDETTPPDRFFDLLGGVDEFSLPPGTHAHMNWTFTDGGVQRLTFELEGTLAGGGGASLNSDVHSYRFFFGELADLPPTEPTIVAPTGLEASYAVGAEVRLSAARYGMVNTLPALWARQCTAAGSGALGPWEPAGEGDQLTTTAQRGCQYVVCLVDGAKVVASSQAVSPRIE